MSESQRALERAVHALTNGRFDARNQEGLKANALESIAWSLVGILANQNAAVAEPAKAAARAAPRPRTRTTATAALVQIEEKA